MAVANNRDLNPANPSTSDNMPELPATTLSIEVNGKCLPYQASDKTLLNCLEKHNVEVHYHCRDGFCGACRITLSQGNITYPNGEPLAFVGDNEILPCCCVPTSNISLLID